jgi:hypothetical protein
MALQTFTTGQVLTAAQISSLQANDYNQTVSTKTANYVLTIADLGSRVFMNAAGATTITVNTGIFAAGDTLWLGNIGAGACVVTAGTATVSKFSTASLTLSQYQGAFLYFVSTGVAILYSDAAGAAFPVTTKGDLFGYDTAAARIPIGTNNQVLTADSAQALGLKWATPSSGGMTLITSGTFSGTTDLSLTSISGSYNDLRLIVTNGYTAASANYFLLSANGVSSGVYTQNKYNTSSTALTNASPGNVSLLEDTTTGSNAANTAVATFYNYAESSNAKMINISAVYYSNSNAAWWSQFVNVGLRITAAITQLNVKSSSAMTGNYYLYGIK